MILSYYLQLKYTSVCNAYCLGKPMPGVQSIYNVICANKTYLNTAILLYNPNPVSTVNIVLCIRFVLLHLSGHPWENMVVQEETDCYANPWTLVYDMVYMIKIDMWYFDFFMEFSDILIENSLCGVHIIFTCLLFRQDLSYTS